MSILRLSLWFGLLTSAAEFLILAYQKFAQDKLRVLSFETAGLLPIAYVLFFGLCGLVLWLAARPRRGRSLSPRFAFAVLATISFWSLLLLFRRLHPAAGFVLALGGAVQATRWIHARPDRVRHVVDRSLLPLAIFAALLMTAGLSAATMRERRAWSALPAAPRNAPNVILLILDTVRSMSMSLYGYARPTTPNLERIAHTGVLFERAIATAPWTVPSHASMFTGRFPYELGSGWDLPLRDSFPTLAESLSRQGYATSAFVANIYYASKAFKLDRGFARYEDRPISAGQLVLSFSPGRWISNREWVRRLTGYSDVLNRKPAAKVNDDFLRWLERRPQHRPFFAFLNYYDAHEPYLPPAPHAGRFAFAGKRETYWYDTDRAERHESKRREPPKDTRAQLGAYDGAIAYIDEQIGELFSELSRRGVLDNTLVVITSDHGEEFREHGVLGHIETIYTTTIQVPLLVVWPGRVPSGLVVNDVVSLRDLPATITDVTGQTAAHHFAGLSLARYWQPVKASAPDIVLSEMTGFSKRKSLIRNPLHYIRDGDAGDELYDLANDPLEQKNLAVSADSRVALAGMKAALEQILRSKGTP